jgi:hypothetical protein
MDLDRLLFVVKLQLGVHVVSINVILDTGGL